MDISFYTDRYCILLYTTRCKFFRSVIKFELKKNLKLKMETDTNGRIVKTVKFTVRNDKIRGILIERMATKNNMFFFKYHDQPSTRHCEQMQKIIEKMNVKRTKTISVNIIEFAHEYFHNNMASFKRAPLESINSQLQNTHTSTIKKEIGLMKRSITFERKKNRKIEENNAAAEKRFQIERANRIHELFRTAALQGSSHVSQSAHGGVDV